MLTFYTDAGLTRPVTLATPKLFCISLEGGTRYSKLYLGDNYSGAVAQVVSIGATTILLDQADEFLPQGGTATIAGTEQITYTGKTNSSLTGVTGVTSSFAVGTPVKPNLKYVVPGNILVAVAGGDAIGTLSQISLSLKSAAQDSYGFRGTPVIFNSASILSNASLEIDVEIIIQPGIDQTYANLELIFSGYVVRAAEDSLAIQGSETRLTTACPIEVVRHNQGIVLHERLLPLNRKVNANLPGFVVGQYRWRDPSTINAQAIIPTNWNVDISNLLPTDFVSGIANGDDLKPLTLEEYQNSLYLRIQDGFYFTGKERSYLAAGSMLEIVPSGSEALTCNLLQSPASQTPIYVGTWVSNQSGSFLKDTQYRYCGKAFDTTKTDNQFIVNRAAKTITLNNPMPVQNILLGVVSGDPIDYFDLSIYPVYGVSQVYIDRGPNLSKLIASSYDFNQEEGTLKVQAIAGSVLGQPIFAVCNPGVAILYAQSGSWNPGSTYAEDVCIIYNGFIFRNSIAGNSGARQPLFPLTPDATVIDGDLLWTCEGPVDTIRADADLNPAFAGISQGYLYLAQNFQGGYQIQLSCDKPRIAIPPASAEIPGLIAFGPVYYDGDYALLIATVLDSNQNPVSNVELQVVPGENFEGTVNYQDPMTTAITVRTGGDGVANLVYTPVSGFGYYIPLSSISTTTVAGDTITLPLEIPLSQIWNETEGWLTTLYQVKDDNPYYGIMDANTAAGQIQFTTTGTPGTTSYKTNGRRAPILNAVGGALAPIEARDSLGNKTTDTGFTGSVVSLTFAVTIPVDVQVAAYFISYIERVTLRVEAVSSNIKSNSILLQMAPPPLIADTTPYLILDNITDGTLDVQRLGYAGANLYFPGTALI